MKIDFHICPWILSLEGWDSWHIHYIYKDSRYVHRYVERLPNRDIHPLLGTDREKSRKWIKPFHKIGRFSFAFRSHQGGRGSTISLVWDRWLSLGGGIYCREQGEIWLCGLEISRTNRSIVYTGGVHVHVLTRAVCGPSSRCTRVYMPSASMLPLQIPRYQSGLWASDRIRCPGRE